MTTINIDRTVVEQALDALERIDQVDAKYDVLSFDLLTAVVESILELRAAISQPVHPAKGLFIDMIASHGPEFVAEMARVGVQPIQSLEPSNAIVTAAQKVLDEFGTASDGLQDLYQAPKKHTR